MNQMLIDFTPGARVRDPATSHLAASQAKELAARHHRIILECLEQHGALGKDGIGARTNLTGVAVCRRLSELHVAGAIRTTGKTVTSTAGRQEREWMLA